MCALYQLHFCRFLLKCRQKHEKSKCVSCKTLKRVPAFAETVIVKSFHTASMYISLHWCLHKEHLVCLHVLEILQWFDSNIHFCQVFSYIFSKNLQKWCWWHAHICIENYVQDASDQTTPTIDEFCGKINVTIYWQCILTHFDWDVLCMSIVVFVQKSTFMVWLWKK